MPEDLREQIYTEAEQNARRKQTANTAHPAGVPPIQITNVLPGHIPAQVDKSPKAEASPVELDGLRDQRLQDYCDWQQSQVRSSSWKAEFQKATDYLVSNCIDLELLYDEDQDPHTLAKEARVKIGIARRYYRDIKSFAKRRRLTRADTEEGG